MQLLRRRSTCYGTLLMLASVYGWGQQESSSHERITAAAGDVSVRVLIDDKGNKAVPGLRAEDLGIVDAGRRLDSRELQIEGNAGTRDQLITVILDQMDADATRSAARAAAKILKGLGERPYSISVWMVGDAPRLVQPFTRDRGRVIAMLANLRADQQDPPLAVNASAAITAAATEKETAWADSAHSALLESRLLREERNLPMGLATMIAAAHSERALDGRKAVLYFTEQIPDDQAGAGVLHIALQILRDASVSLFAFDMNAINREISDGMVSAMVMGNTESVRAVNNVPSTTVPPPRLRAPPTMRDLQIRDTINNFEFDGMTQYQTSLDQVAEMSGGAYSGADINTRKISRALAANLANYYTVTYSASAAQLDGKFHPVHVSATRPGVYVAAQPGYFATRGSAGAPVLFGGGSELTRLSESATGTGLTLRAATSQSGPRTSVELEVPIRPLELPVDGSTQLVSLHLSVAAEIKNPAGVVVAHFGEEVRRHEAPDQVDRLRGESITIRRAVDLPPGDYHLEAVVRDWNGGSIGRLSEALHPVSSSVAPALSAAAKTAPRDPAAQTVPAGETTTEAAARPFAAELLAAEPVAAAGSGPSPSASQAAALIEAARTRALAYSAGVPNFVCVETIDRAIDHHGSDDWKHQDTIVELLRFRDFAETRTVLEVNGERTSVEPTGPRAAHSNGEFGGILLSIFDPAAAAEFHWLRTERRESGAVEVFSYKVREAQSGYYLTDPTGMRAQVGFHGLVFVDPETHAVMRLVAQTDQVPSALAVRGSWMAIDYDYLAINGHDYLLPVRGEVGLKQGRHEVVRNQLRFTNYRRFGSTSRIVDPNAVAMSPAAVAPQQ